jgi:ParB-like chromosome segregation protein Spo0J
MKVHPVAELFPLMSEEELAELAHDIKTNGLLNPVIVDKNGVLIDGRNRLRACELAGVEPRLLTLNGTDPVAFILAQNITRRHLNKGQQAIIVAQAHLSKFDNHGAQAKIEAATGTKHAALSDAIFILRYRGDLAESVINGSLAFDRALEEARESKKAAESAEYKLEELSKGASDLDNLSKFDNRKMQAKIEAATGTKHSALSDGNC